MQFSENNFIKERTGLPPHLERSLMEALKYNLSVIDKMMAFYLCRRLLSGMDCYHYDPDENDATYMGRYSVFTDLPLAVFLEDLSVGEHLEECRSLTGCSGFVEDNLEKNIDIFERVLYNIIESLMRKSLESFGEDPADIPVSPNFYYETVYPFLFSSFEIFSSGRKLCDITRPYILAVNAAQKK